MEFEVFALKPAMPRFRRDEGWGQAVQCEAWAIPHDRAEDWSPAPRGGKIACMTWLTDLIIATFVAIGRHRRG
jgi:hypothetical protein